MIGVREQTTPSHAGHRYHKLVGCDSANSGLILIGPWCIDHPLKFVFMDRHAAQGLFQNHGVRVDRQLQIKLSDPSGFLKQKEKAQPDHGYHKPERSSHDITLPIKRSLLRAAERFWAPNMDRTREMYATDDAGCIRYLVGASSHSDKIGINHGAHGGTEEAKRARDFVHPGLQEGPFARKTA